MYLVQDFKSRIGVGEGAKSVCGGRMIERMLGSWESPCAAWYAIMEKILRGFFDEVMMVVIPVSVAISAAMSLVSIPPVPRLEPRVLVLTADYSRCKHG